MTCDESTGQVLPSNPVFPPRRPAGSKPPTPQEQVAAQAPRLLPEYDVRDACVEAIARAVVESRGLNWEQVDPVDRDQITAEARAAFAAVKEHEVTGHQWETVVPAGLGAEYVQCVACGHTGWVV